MTEVIRQIHNAAMELADLARIKKARDGDTSMYDNYLRAAYELELYAALKIKDNDIFNDQLWKANLLRSAGWLAYKCGYYEEAQSLAETGLKIPTDGYALSKLEDLKTAVEKKWKTLKQSSNQEASPSVIYGFFTAADIEANQINIRKKEDKKNLTLSVPNDKLRHIVRQFLGETVEVEIKNSSEGQPVLENIRWAA